MHYYVTCPIGYEFENAIKQANSAGEEHAEGSPSKKQLDYKKSAWLAALFLVSTLIQVYVGLKCISFNYTRETEEGALMGLEVLWVNIIAWLLRELVQRATKDEGELCPNLHPHRHVFPFVAVCMLYFESDLIICPHDRLHLHTALAAHWCDLCGQQCKDGRAYRCKLCDFDLCIICYAKKDTFTLEGQLRGDKVSPNATSISCL